MWQNHVHTDQQFLPCIHILWFQDLDFQSFLPDVYGVCVLSFLSQYIVSLRLGGIGHLAAKPQDQLAVFERGSNRICAVCLKTDKSRDPGAATKDLQGLTVLLKFILGNSCKYCFWYWLNMYGEVYKFKERWFYSIQLMCVYVCSRASLICSLSSCDVRTMIGDLVRFFIGGYRRCVFALPYTFISGLCTSPPCGWRRWMQEKSTS